MVCKDKNVIKISDAGGQSHLLNFEKTIQGVSEGQEKEGVEMKKNTPPLPSIFSPNLFFTLFHPLNSPIRQKLFS